MKKIWKEAKVPASDRKIRLESALIALLVFGLPLCLKHAAPEPVQEEHSRAGAIQLLLPGTEKEKAAFRRWAKLNDPGRLFSYRDNAPFAAVAMTDNRELPHTLARSIPDLERLPGPLASPVPVLAEKAACGLPAMQAPPPAMPEIAADSWKNSKIQVWKGDGTLAAELPPLPFPEKGGPVLFRVEKMPCRLEAALLCSSGNRNFDQAVSRSIAAGIGDMEDGTIFAVWPEFPATTGGVKP